MQQMNNNNSHQNLSGCLEQVDACVRWGQKKVKLYESSIHPRKHHLHQKLLALVNYTGVAALLLHRIVNHVSMSIFSPRFLER